MVTYLLNPSPFVRLAGFLVDDALSCAMGWNYYFLMGESTLLPPSSCSDGSRQHSTSPTKSPHPRSPHLLDGKVPVYAVMLICIALYASVSPNDLSEPN